VRLKDVVGAVVGFAPGVALGCGAGWEGVDEDVVVVGVDVVT
jgi:hypothetical protein